MEMAVCKAEGGEQKNEGCCAPGYAIDSNSL